MKLSWDWDGYRGYGPDVRGPELWRWIWKFFPATFVVCAIGLTGLVVILVGAA